MEWAWFLEMHFRLLRVWSEPFDESAREEKSGAREVWQCIHNGLIPVTSFHVEQCLFVGLIN